MAESMDSGDTALQAARESFGTYQRAQERAVAYTVLAHKNILTRSAHICPVLTMRR